MDADKNLRNLWMIIRHTKKDLRIMTADGTEFLGHRIVLGFFSKFLTDLFLSCGKDDDLTSLVVPLTDSELELVFSVVYGDRIIDGDLDCEALERSCSILNIDLPTVFTSGTEPGKQSVETDKENSFVEPAESVKDETADSKSPEEIGITPAKKGTKYNKKRLSDPSLVFSCEKCPIRFKRISSLKKHNLVEHNIKIICEKCSDSFINFKAYQKHRVIHINFVCDECGEQCPSKSQLNQHEYKAHGKGDIDKPCPYCAKQVYNLKAHIQGSHEADFIFCTKCDYATRNKHSMKDHTENIHREAILKTCQFCGGSYKRVDKHIKVSNCGKKERIKIDCDQCDKSFMHKDTLNKHVKLVHFQIRNKVCLYCDYRTHTKFNLDIHMNKMHLGKEVKKESCRFCNKTTYKIEHHMKIYHGDILSDDKDFTITK